RAAHDPPCVFLQQREEALQKHVPCGTNDLDDVLPWKPMAIKWYYAAALLNGNLFLSEAPRSAPSNHSAQDIPRFHLKISKVFLRKFVWERVRQRGDHHAPARKAEVFPRLAREKRAEIISEIEP